MPLGSQRDVYPRTSQNHSLQQLEGVQASKHTAGQVCDLVAIEDPGEKQQREGGSEGSFTKPQQGLSQAASPPGCLL